MIIMNAFLKHLPSLSIGSAMFVFDSKGPFVSPCFVFMTCAAFYLIIFILGIPFEVAQNTDWMWSKNDLSEFHNHQNTTDYTALPLTVPFGCILALKSNSIRLNAIFHGLP